MESPRDSGGGGGGGGGRRRQGVAVVSVEKPLLSSTSFNAAFTPSPRHLNRQTDRQTGRQAGRQAGKQADR